MLMIPFSDTLLAQLCQRGGTKRIKDSLFLKLILFRIRNNTEVTETYTKTIHSFPTRPV